MDLTLSTVVAGLSPCVILFLRHATGASTSAYEPGKVLDVTQQDLAHVQTT